MQNGALQGKTALVLGGSKGIGLGVAKAFAEAGARVAVTSRNIAAAEEISSTLPGAFAFGCDTGSMTSIEALARDAEATLGAIDILVLNSGGPPAGPVLDVKIDAYRTAFESLFLGPAHLTSLLLPGMMERGYGRILTVGSSGMIEPIPHLAISNVIRPAAVGWSKTLSREVAASGVTVNILVPGRIQTDRVNQIDASNANKSGQSVDAVKTASLDRIPAGRYGTIEEFGATAAFLAGPAAGYITGSMIRIDGGMLASVG